MNVGFEVKINEEHIKEARDLFEFIGGNSRDAIRVAINKAGPKIKTLASSEIRKQVRLSAGYVGERLQFVRATNARLSGEISTPSRGLLLSKYSTDASVASDKVSWIKAPPQPKGGIKVKVKPSAGTKPVRGDSETTGKPFYIVLRNSGALGIGARRKVPGPKGGKIKVFHSASLSQVFSDVRNDVLPEAGEEYTRQLIDAMRFLLAKRKPQE